jgi:hypothetical protein
MTTDGEAAALAHIATLDEPRRSRMAHRHEVITSAIPDAGIRMFEYGGTLIGYGPYRYSNSAGKEVGDWFSVGLASRKSYVSLFSMGLRDGRYLVEAEHQRFPGTEIGRSCLNIKDATPVDDDAVRDLVRATWAQYRDGQPPRLPRATPKAKRQG